MRTVANLTSRSAVILYNLTYFSHATMNCPGMPKIRICNGGVRSQAPVLLFLVFSSALSVVSISADRVCQARVADQPWGARNSAPAIREQISLGFTTSYHIPGLADRERRCYRFYNGESHS